MRRCLPTSGDDAIGGGLAVLGGSYAPGEGVFARARRRLETLSLRPGAPRVKCRVRRVRSLGLAAAALGRYRQGLANFPPKDFSPSVALEA